MKRTDLLLLGAAMVCGAGFLASLDRLWPVADLPISPGPLALERMAREHQDAVGQDLAGWSVASQLVVDEPALSWLERTGPRRGTQELLAELPVYLQEVQFKKAGDPGAVTFWIHPRQGLAGWKRVTDDDEAGARVDFAFHRDFQSVVVAVAVGVVAAAEDLLVFGLRERGRMQAVGGGEFEALGELDHGWLLMIDGEREKRT